MIHFLSAVCSGKTVQELEHDINASIVLEEQAEEGQLIELYIPHDVDPCIPEQADPPIPDDVDPPYKFILKIYTVVD